MIDRALTLVLLEIGLSAIVIAGLTLLAMAAR
jgi:hypothetical protein